MDRLAEVEAVRDTFRQLLEAGVRGVWTADLNTRVRSAQTLFEGAASVVQYEMSEAAFAAAAEGVHAFYTEFLPKLNLIIAPYEVTLLIFDSVVNYDVYMHLCVILQFALVRPLAMDISSKVAAATAKALEAKLRRKRYNHLGGLQVRSVWVQITTPALVTVMFPLQVEADVRALVAFFVSRAGRASAAQERRKFDRLLQITQLLAFESPAEVLDFYRSGALGPSWDLDADEVKAVMGLRTDFDSEEVAKINLRGQS